MAREDDPFDLDRFLRAQEQWYPYALAELRDGRKRSHWIWFILPQLRGLGSSTMSVRYGLVSLDEARAYLAHPVLGARLVECVEAILAHAGTDGRDILGDVDALKFRSCLTLFVRAAGPGSVFGRALDAFYGGTEDAATLARLSASTASSGASPRSNIP